MMDTPRENSTHDSGVWLLDRIMNQMNAGVYITDVDTDEILFMNSGMKKQFGLVEPEGKICWQVLQKGTPYGADIKGASAVPSAPCRVCCGTALPQHRSAGRNIIPATAASMKTSTA